MKILSDDKEIGEGIVTCITFLAITVDTFIVLLPQYYTHRLYLSSMK